MATRWTRRCATSYRPASAAIRQLQRAGLERRRHAEDAAVDAGPVRHLIQIETVDAFVRRCLGVDLQPS